MTAIAVKDLTKRFGANTVVDHVSMTVQEGEIVGFLGPNGSGKTTTIRMMCGLLTPDEGSGSVLGYDVIADSRLIKNEVGYMTQRFSFYEDLTIAENLEFVARLYRQRPVKAHVARTIEALGLTARRNQLSGTLSGGWKQRLALAACIMHSPRLLLLDEPTAGVDPKARREFWDQIHELAGEGMTMLVSTHYMDEAERCHRINYISYGKLIASGTVNEVVTSSGLHTFIVQGRNLDNIGRRLIGQPGVERVAPFGTTLHVVGSDEGLLANTLRPLSDEPGIRVAKGETSLEDVFIKLMGRSKDNFQ